MTLVRATACLIVALASLAAAEDLRFVYGRGEEDVTLDGVVLDGGTWNSNDLYQLSFYEAAGPRFSAVAFEVSRAEGKVGATGLRFSEYSLEAQSGLALGGGSSGFLIDVGIIGGGGLANLEVDGLGDDTEWFFRYGAQATVSISLGGPTIGVGYRWTWTEIGFDLGGGLGDLEQEGDCWFAFVAWRL